jgi:hypothetical protein
MKSTTTEVKAKINAHILSYFEPDMYGNADCDIHQISADGEDDGLTWFHCDAHDKDTLSELVCEGVEAIDNLRDQMKSFDYMPTAYAGGKYMAEGGTFLVYYKDQRDFLNGLGINEDGKEFSDNKVFEQYCHLIGRQVAELVKE